MSQLKEKKYLLRSSVEPRKAKRLSHHRLGLDGGIWLETFLAQEDWWREWWKLHPQKRLNYQRGIQAITSMVSAF